MTHAEARDRALLCVGAALDKKAYDVVLLDVAELTSLADFFCICTGRSDTQVQAITQSIDESLRRRGITPLSIEGHTHGQWVIIDCGDVVAHVFNEPVREFYDLERLWARAPRLALPEPYQSLVRDLRPASEAR